MAKVDPSQLGPYAAAGWTMIPLHRHDHFDVHKGKKRQRGKSPLHKNWTKRVYRQEDAAPHMGEGRNVGIRLSAGELVVDVDPRNFPPGETLATDNPFRRLCADCGIDPERCPTVETGSGGLHLYMRKPEDVSIRDSMPDYPGVEFKTLGRQVVAAGSLHPDTGRNYEWDFLRPGLTEAGDAPERLLRVIRRPLGASQASGGGEYDQEEVARMLDALDPEDFRDHSDWFTLMQACHHASAGDARSEFIEWSTRDPEFSDHGGEIGLRWDSLHSDASGPRVTYRTLLKTLHERGAAEAIPRTPAEDDFADEDDARRDADDGEEGEGGDDDPERLGPLERLNLTHWAVMVGGKFRVMWEEEDPTYDPPRKYWVQSSATDFRQMLSNRRVQRDDKAIPLADAWLDWGQRRTARGIVFDPVRDHPGTLNLWTGWGVVPRKKEGGWSMLEELLRDTLCDGDARVYDYVLNWAAHMVQNPGKPAEVAVCFQGGKGTGKGTFGRALASIAGRHGMQITSSEHLTGRFNSHLRDVVLLFADEAINPYDKAGESRLKGLITEPVLAFEGKGVDLVTGRNHLHVVMASNEDWFVPMGLDGERRFLLQRVNNSRQGQTGFFEELNVQLATGGLEALLWDLLNRDLAGWSPRDSIPSTRASLEQKVRGMTPVAQWWFNALCDGMPPFELAGQAGSDWALDRVRAFKSDVRGSFEDFGRRTGIRTGSSGRSLEMMFAGEIEKLVPGLGRGKRVVVPDDRPDVRAHGDGRAWAFEFPSLSECRTAMEALLGGEVDWE